MKKFIPVIVFVILAIGAYEYGLNRMVPNPDPNHTHADFAVWIGGERVDFAQEKYMTEELTANQLQALKNSTATGSALQVLKQYLHLHDMNGQVIHSHKPGLMLGDFFGTLPDVLYLGQTITINGKTTDVHLYVNGQPHSSASAYVFNDGDRLLLTNSIDVAEIKHEMSLVTDDSCMLSKTCPGRGEPPTENCISDPMIPCIAP